MRDVATCAGLLAAIHDKKPFAVSRWGDNEWKVLFDGPAGHDANGAGPYFNDLRSSLWSVLRKEPEYFLIMTSSDQRAGKLLPAAGLGELKWLSGDLTPPDYASGYALLAEVNKAAPIVIGPPQLRRARALLNCRGFVDIPPRHAFLRRKEIVRETMSLLSSARDTTLISVSAGVCSPLLVDDLHRQVGNRAQIVDFGRLWDPCVPRVS